MKITDIKVIRLSAPIPADKQYTSDLGTVTRVHAAIVRVDTDEGITGYGEAKGTPSVMKALVEDYLRPQLLGEDPTRVEYLWEKMYNGTRLGLALRLGRSQPAHGSRGETLCAISGIDVALWDILGKSLGQPIYKLLGGGFRTRVRAYASGGHAPVDRIGEQLLGYVAKGFRGCKIRVGGIDYPRMVDGSAARIRAARKALGDDVELMMDAHGSTSVKEAIALGRAVEESRVSWYEEPVSMDNLAGLQEVRAGTSVPVATGENGYTRFAFRELAEARAADIWQPDVAMVGGITETRRVAALAWTHDIPLAPHVWGSALLWAASLQLAAAIPNCLIFEFGQTYSPLLYELLTTPVQVEKDGYVNIPSGPGLGIEIDPDAEKRYPFEEGAERIGLSVS